MSEPIWVLSVKRSLILVEGNINVECPHVPQPVCIVERPRLSHFTYHNILSRTETTGIIANTPRQSGPAGAVREIMIIRAAGWLLGGVREGDGLTGLVSVSITHS